MNWVGRIVLFNWRPKRQRNTSNLMIDYFGFVPFTLHKIPRIAAPYIPKESQNTTPRKYSLIFKTLYLKVWTVLTVCNLALSPLYPCTLINSMLFSYTKDILPHPLEGILSEWGPDLLRPLPNFYLSDF